MKYIIDEDVKSVCDEIAGMKLPIEDWHRHDKKTFWRASCVCVFRDLGPRGCAFHFMVRGARDLMCAATPLSLEEVLRISYGYSQELEIQPPYGEHQEDVGARRVEVDPEVLFFAITDAINVFVREVLVPRGLIDAEAYSCDPDLLVQRNRIARHWADHWRVSWKNDAGQTPPANQ